MKQEQGLDSLDLSAIAESRALRAQGFRPQPISNSGCDNMDALWLRVLKAARELGNEQCSIL